MTGDGGGAAASFGGNETQGVATTADGLSGVAAFVPDAIQRSAQGLAERRIQIFGRTRAHRVQNYIRAGAGVQGENERRSGRGANATNDLIQRLPQAGDVDEHYLRAHAVDFFEQHGQLPDFGLFQNYADRQFLQIGVQFVPEFLGLNDDAGR